MLAFDTPLRTRHQATRLPEAPAATVSDRPGAATGVRADGPAVEYISYGPPDDAGLIQCEVPATFGPVELEYAALRGGVAVLDCPHRSLIRVTGDAGLDFLDRMLTQALATLPLGGARESFWLNRTGKIESDLFVVRTDGEILIELDVHQAAQTCTQIEGFLFAEDVVITDLTGQWYVLAVHGPDAAPLVAEVAGEAAGALESMQSVRVELAGAPAVVVRHDQIGGPGFLVFCPREHAVAVWDALMAGSDPAPRPAGWYAYNMARIEAGTPLFNVDFGSTNLPHETGVVERRVSFAKGCYLGQEIVARLQNLGKPKQELVGLRMRGDGLPIAGAQVFARGEGADGADLGTPVGVVTSSTLAPMLGAQPVAFALVRRAHADPGTIVVTSGDGALVEAEVGSLEFYDAASSKRSDASPA